MITYSAFPVFGCVHGGWSRSARTYAAPLPRMEGNRRRGDIDAIRLSLEIIGIPRPLKAGGAGEQVRISAATDGKKNGTSSRSGELAVIEARVFQP